MIDRMLDMMRLTKTCIVYKQKKANDTNLIVFRMPAATDRMIIRKTTQHPMLRTSLLV